MEFIETPTFTKRITKLLPDGTYADLQAYIAENPERASVMKGTGGARKIRWSIDGRGKSGGVRVVYYVDLPDACYMLFVFAKNEQANLTAKQRETLRRYIQTNLKR